MKLNELVCPNCGLKCLTKSYYATCAGCRNFFYASQSATCNPPPPNVQIIPIQVYPTTPITGPYYWQTPYTTTGGSGWSGTISTGGRQEGYLTWN